MKKIDLKTIVIIVLSLILFGIILFKFVFSSKPVVKNFITDIMTVETELNKYVAKIDAYAYGAYTKSEILSGLTQDDNKEITNNKNEKLSRYITKEVTTTFNNITYYKIDMNLLQKELNIKMSEWDNTSWYVNEYGKIKVKLEKTPMWWIGELDDLKI